ncbi:MAG: 5'-Nucleotidase domain protein [Bacteroidetes bacterium]|nr:5'-Nucleotidase domain protein [Bacteroidota bacterium]
MKWECDLRPAYYQVKLGGDSLSDIQGTFTVRVADVDSIIKWGVWMNGPAVGGWSNDGGDWGLGLQNNLAKKLYDNGTNGDRVAGDSIFTRQVLASPDSVAIGSKDRVGQTFKFGVRGGDNEGGRGGFGNNHNENIVDTDTIYTMSTQFGSINPAFYDAWDYDLRKPKTPTSVIDPNAPLVYELAQNYPNPFNPATKIEYSIPMQSQVELKIYNLVGQEVGTLVNEIQKAGVHNVKFDAGNLASGVYFYRLVAGNFTSVKKMVLLK